MKKNNYLIFDFDGTLVNSFPIMLEKLAKMANQFGMKKISPNEIDVLREMPSRILIKHLQIPLYKLPSLIFQVRKSMKAEIQNILPFAGLPEVLVTLVERGYKLGILTSNSQENVTSWLVRHNLNSLFDFIHDETSFFRKQRSLRNILKIHHLDKEVTCYIGDETRDIDAAHANAIHSVAVTWGFNSERVLRKHHPNSIVNKPNDLLTIFL